MDVSSRIADRPEFVALTSFAQRKEGDVSIVVNKFLEQIKSTNKDQLAETQGLQWDTIIAVAGQTPHEDQSRLVDFLGSFQGEVTKVQGGEVEPPLGWQMREAWNYSPKDPQVDEASKARWVNQNAFAARLTAVNGLSDSKDPLDFSLYAIWTMREALEDDAPEETPGQGALRAAAVWALYSADRLWALTTKGREFDGKVAKPGRKYKDESWRGFNKERWVAWKNELKKLGTNTDSETSQLLGQALQKLEAAEKA